MYGQNRLRPLGIGDLLDEVFRTYRQHFLLVMAIALAVTIPLGAIDVAWTAMARAAGVYVTPEGLISQASLSLWMAYSGLSLAIGLVSIVGYLTMEGALAHAVARLYLGGAWAASPGLLGYSDQEGQHGEKPTLSSSYGAVLRRLPSLLVATIIGSILLGLLTVTIIGAPVALWLGVRWCLYVQALVLEDKGPWSAIMRSSELVKGNWWRILGILLLLVILQWLLLAVLGIVAGALVATLGPASLVYTLASNVLSTIVNTLVLPIWFMGFAMVYVDQRVRKEGLDLEQLASQVLPVAPTGEQEPNWS